MKYFIKLCSFVVQNSFGYLGQTEIEVKLPALLRFCQKVWLTLSFDYLKGVIQQWRKFVDFLRRAVI